MNSRVVELEPTDYWEITAIDPDSVVTAPIPRLDAEPTRHRRQPYWQGVTDTKRDFWLTAGVVFSGTFVIVTEVLAIIHHVL